MKNISCYDDKMSESLSSLNASKFPKENPLIQETSVLTNCTTCNGPITKENTACPHCYLISIRNKVIPGEKKAQCAQTTYHQQGSLHLDYVRPTDDEVCHCCSTRYPGSNLKISSKSSDSPGNGYKSSKKESNYNSNKSPYSNTSLERTFDDYYTLRDEEDKSYPSTSNASESEESVATICGKVNGVETMILLDTGSSISAITESFALQLNLETWYTDDVLVVTLANTHVERYPERMCIVTFEIGDLRIYEELNVLPGQIYDITLGKNWLKAHMAICDYGMDILRLPGSRPIRMGVFASNGLFKSLMNPKNTSPRKSNFTTAQCKFTRASKKKT